MSCSLPAGIEPTGNRVLRPAVFTVDTFSAGQGQVSVYLDHPDGTREEVQYTSSSASDLVREYSVAPYSIVLFDLLNKSHATNLKHLPVWFVDQLKAELNEGKKTFSVTYVPQVTGDHKVNLCLTVYNLQYILYVCFITKVFIAHFKSIK